MVHNAVPRDIILSQLLKSFQSKNKCRGKNITNLAKMLVFIISCDLLFGAASKRNNNLIVGIKITRKIMDSVVLAGIRARCHCVNKKWYRGMITKWSIT